MIQKLFAKIGNNLCAFYFDKAQHEKIKADTPVSEMRRYAFLIISIDDNRILKTRFTIEDTIDFIINEHRDSMRLTAELAARICENKSLELSKGLKNESFKSIIMNVPINCAEAIRASLSPKFEKVVSSNDIIF